MSTISFLAIIIIAWTIRELVVGTHTWFLRRNMQKTYRHKNIIDPAITRSGEPTKIQIPPLLPDQVRHLEHHTRWAGESMKRAQTEPVIRTRHRPKRI